MIFRLSKVALLALSLTLTFSGSTVLFAQEEAKQGPTDKDAPKEFTKTASGLKYKILRKSDKKKPTRKDTITIHYKGWLDDGKEFDGSYKRGKPSTFPLGRLIAAWQEALPLVGEGGMIELEVPPELGYGELGSPPVIPPSATLHFIVELIEIK